MAGERGSALIIALLVTFILSLLGVSFLMMAKTEGSIAYNERLGLQTLYMAEAGARAVGTWFDRPSSTTLGFPPAEVIDRSQRLILDEDDPYVNAPVGSSPLYKQGVNLDGLGGDDLFERPYRGDPAHTLLGLEQGPDMRIDDQDPEARAYLKQLSATLLGDAVASPGRVLRLSLIDVYAPPYVLGGDGWARLGMGTIAVTARLYRTDPQGNELPDALAERTVRWVLNEIPYRTPVFGPLHTCGDLTLAGDLTVHWGTITVIGDVHGYDGDPGNENIPPSLPRAQTASASRTDLLWTSDAACLDTFTQNVNPAAAVEDPWLRLFSHGSIDSLVDPCESEGYSPAICDPGATPPWAAGQWPCCNHCNKDQHNPFVLCPAGESFTTSKPVYVYEYWKNVATSGGRNVFYLVPDGDTKNFKENGIGPPLTFEEITNGRQGLFFFDTKDGLPPRGDDDDDGVADNLSPEIVVSGAWQSAGYIFLNTRKLTVANLSPGASTLPMRAPGEPFIDDDGDHVFDAGEAWVNLSYPDALELAFRVDAADGMADDGPAGAPSRNARGPAIPTAVSFRGILLTTGSLSLAGSGVIYGSLIAQGGVNVSGDGPDVYWAGELAEEWPPEGFDLPRVTVTRWSEQPWGALP